MADYVVASELEIQEMLEAIGKEKLTDLYHHLPQAALLNEPLNLPKGLSEMEVRSKMSKLAQENTSYATIFRGYGAYKHYIPSIVDHLSSRSEFVTSYTPYQAEVSQGTLQAIFEFQSMIAALTGLYAANASVYDGATAAGEALMMCQDRKRHRVLFSDTINPNTQKVLLTYCYCFDMPYAIINSKDGLTDAQHLKSLIDEETSCVYIEQLNRYGIIEDIQTLSTIAHQQDIKLIMGANPIALAILPSAKDVGADICVGEAQPLGLPLGFGGPYCGFMVSTKELMRKLPGRIVGQTTDTQGRMSYVLTLQAREQHIRREKASSSICSNQSLMAVRATIYLASMGSELPKVAQRCVDNAHYLASELSNLEGFKLKYNHEFFHEFVIESSLNTKTIEDILSQHNILSGVILSESEMLWCATEMNNKQEIDEVIQLLKEAQA